MREHRIALVRRRASRGLRGVVAGLVGMSEQVNGVVRRRQPAGSLIPLVISFGNRINIESLSDAHGAGASLGSFVAGFSTGHATTSFTGGQDCVQAYLHPVGVRRILGVPGREVARHVIAAEDLIPGVDILAERLAAASSWSQRLSLVEAELEQVLRCSAVDVPSWVEWMWGRIRASGGQVQIGELVAHTGWSHRHVTAQFTEHVGLSPKQAADVVRFEAAMGDLGRLPLAELAVRHGYADQSHLTRAVTRHAGEPPARLAAARRPTALTALGLDQSGPGSRPIR